MIEVLVAVLILVLAALATFGLLSAATKNTARAKATQVALDRAQQEVEALRGLKNEKLAMTAPPPYSGDVLNPDHRVKESNGSFALTREPPGRYATMVVEGGRLYGKSGEEGVIKGVVNPGPIPFTSGDVRGEVYRYVVWRNDEKCPEEKCPGRQDFKQIVVAVKLDTPGNQAGERGYVEVQSDFINPTSGPESDPLPPPGEKKVVTAQQFFLSDTPCAKEQELPTERQEITRDHLLHNTLGTCASGPQTGTTYGAPDALLLGGPPDRAPNDPNDPPLYDYSSDPYLEPTLNPENDKGVQIRHDETTNGCLYDPANKTTSPHPESQVHRWVTDPMTSDFTLTGNVTLEFYTRSLNEAKHTGTLCVYLYKRHETEDTLLANGGTGYWTYTPPASENYYWPWSEWKRIRLTMSFTSPPYTIPAGDRLGVALSVERGNTPAEAIQIMYDHPSYPARIEVDTNTPIEGG